MAFKNQQYGTPVRGSITGVQDPSEFVTQSPLAGAVLKVATAAQKAQTNKDNAAAYMEGQQRVMQGESLEDIKQEESFANLLFGPSEMLQGAREQTARAAVLNGYADMMGKMDEYKTMSPEEANKYFTETFKQSLTDDDEVNVAILKQSEKLRQSVIKTHLAEHTKWTEQEWARSSASKLSGTVIAAQSAVKGTINSKMYSDVREVAQQVTMQVADEMSGIYKKHPDKAGAIISHQVANDLAAGEMGSYQALLAASSEDIPEGDRVQLNATDLNRVRDAHRRYLENNSTAKLTQKTKESFESDFANLKTVSERTDVSFEDKINSINSLKVKYGITDGTLTGKAYGSRVAKLMASVKSKEVEHQSLLKFNTFNQDLGVLLSDYDTPLSDINTLIKNNSDVVNRDSESMATTVKKVNAYLKEREDVSGEVLVSNLKNEARMLAKEGDPSALTYMALIKENIGNTEEYVALEKELIPMYNSNSEVNKIDPLLETLNRANTHEQLEEVKLDKTEYEALTPSQKIAYSEVVDRVEEKVYSNEREKAKLEAIAATRAGVSNGQILAEDIAKQRQQFFEATGQTSQALLAMEMETKLKEFRFNEVTASNSYHNIKPDEVNHFINYSTRNLSGMEKTLQSRNLLNKLPVDPAMRKKASFALNNLLDQEGRPSASAIQVISNLQALSDIGGDSKYALRQVPSEQREKMATILTSAKYSGSLEDAIMAADAHFLEKPKTPPTLISMYGKVSNYNKAINAKVVTPILDEFGLANDSPSVRYQTTIMANEIANGLAARGLYTDDTDVFQDLVQQEVRERMIDGVVNFTPIDKGDSTANTRDMISHYLKDANNPDRGGELSDKDMVTFHNGTFFVFRGDQTGYATQVIPWHNVKMNWTTSPQYRSEQRKAEAEARKIKAVQEGKSTGNSYYDIMSVPRRQELAAREKRLEQ